MSEINRQYEEDRIRKKQMKESVLKALKERVESLKEDIRKEHNASDRHFLMQTLNTNQYIIRRMESEAT